MTGGSAAAAWPSRPARRRVPRPAPVLSDRPLPWLLPLLLVATAFYLYPVVATLWFASTDGSGTATTANFAAVLASDEAGSMARITLVFVGASVAGQLGFGLLIATLLVAGERRRLPGTAFVRATVMLGWILPGVVLGIIWRLLLDESPSGILAYLLGVLGVRDPVFLSAAGPALLWITVANIWRGTAFSMLVQYSGMKGIPDELYEAARMDGANAWQQFASVTLPSLRRIMLTNLVLITIATLNTFDMVVPLTGGGPGRATEVVALYIYDVVFTQFALHRGAAVATLLAACGGLLTVAYVRLFLRGNEA